MGGLTGQLAVRGAEVGSALVAKLLTFDLSLLVPVALVAGTGLFMVTERLVFRQIGRILIRHWPSPWLSLKYDLGAVPRAAARQPGVAGCNQTPSPGIR